jgi:hypothetical protein
MSSPADSSGSGVVLIWLASGSSALSRDVVSSGRCVRSTYGSRSMLFKLLFRLVPLSVSLIPVSDDVCMWWSSPDPV